MTLSEWRKANGFKDGRGRPSKAEMQARVATGYTHTPQATPTRTRQTMAQVRVSGDAARRTTSDAPAKVTKSPGKVVSDAPVVLWAEDVTFKDEWGQIVARATPCVNCRVSLPYCKCIRPVALGSKGESRLFRYRAGREFSGILAYFASKVVD